MTDAPDRAHADHRDMEIERNMLRATLRDVLERAEQAEARLAAVEALAQQVCTCWPETRHWANCPTVRIRAALAREVPDAEA